MKRTQEKMLLMGSEDIGFVLSLHHPNGKNYANVKLFGTKKECEVNAKKITQGINNNNELLKALKKITILELPSIKDRQKWDVQETLVSIIKVIARLAIAKVEEK